MKRLALGDVRPLIIGFLLLGVIAWATSAPPPSTQRRTEARGIPFGPWHAPVHLLGTEYSGTVLGGPEPYRHLEEVRDRKGQIVIYLARNKSRDRGYLSVPAVERFLANWPDLSPYIKDGTVWGIIVADDITGKKIWGPDAPYYAEIDSIARMVKGRWPGVRTIVRAPVNRMNYPWKWVDWAWVQYSDRFGDVAAYRDRQLALADPLHLCVAFGLNVINGGDGSSGVSRGRRKTWMSADEILKYYRALLPYTPVAFHWTYRPEYEEDPKIQAAMATVRSWADTTARPSCRYGR
jgi:hypothetical protein